MKTGLVGLPSVGKTTLFNLLTGADIDVSEYATGKAESHLGIAKIPDPRVDFLADIYRPKKTTYATIEVTDLPGLMAGSGSGSQFLDSVRKVDALIHVVRVFENEDVLHVEGSIDPMRDIERVNLELLFADLGVIDNRIERIRTSKKVSKENLAELEVLERCKAGLEEGRLIHQLKLSDEEKDHLKTFGFLSEKPMIIVANMDEDQLAAKDYPGKKQLLEYTGKAGVPLVEICTKIDLEISRLDPEDRALFMEDMGIKQSGIDKLAKTAYDHLGLISFLTVGPDEVRAWTIHKNTTAKKAAGKIHSDMEKGFIRAEVYKFEHMKKYGSQAKIREKGLAPLEGKDYIVQDGDIITFRFNV